MGTLPKSRQDVDTLTRQLIDALDRLGASYTRKDGAQQRVVIRRRLLTESGGILLLEVDTQALPRGVKAGRLVHPEILHHLGAVLHHPVRVLNTTGITYAVLLGGDVGRGETLPKVALLQKALTTWGGRPYMIPLGEGATGPVWVPLAGHYLVGGETGSGKTTWILATVAALARLNGPQALRVVVVDPKGVDFLPLAHFPHLAQPIAVTAQEAADLVAWAMGVVDRRRTLFLGTLARDLDQHNERSGRDSLPRIVVVIDEFVTLALQAGLKSPFYKDLTALSSMGRAFGVHLILATQTPKAEVLNTLIRGNLAGRLAFRVTTAQHSRLILGRGGAEKLGRTPGRFLAQVQGLAGLCQLQGYNVGAEDLGALAGDGAGAGPRGDPLALLDGETRQMVEYSLAHLAGRFGQAQVMAGGWSRGKYRRAVNKLKATGLIRKEPSEGDALYLAFDGLDGLDTLTP